MNELQSRILSLNTAKNNYAAKKLKGETTLSDDKELVSSLIYVIAECRRVATDLGITDSKVEHESDDIKLFKHLNQSVKELKSQIIMLTNETREGLKKVISEQSDKQQVEKRKDRLNETRDRLREKIQEKEKYKCN